MGSTEEKVERGICYGRQDRYHVFREDGGVRGHQKGA